MDERGPRVLLVEDEALIGMALEADLQEWGYEVVYLPSGVEAIAWLDRGGTMDIVVTDVRMPGQDGWALARRARELQPDIPVIYISGDRTEGDWRAQGVPGSVMFAKPVQLEVLAAEVKARLKT